MPLSGSDSHDAQESSLFLQGHGDVSESRSSGIFQSLLPQIRHQKVEASEAALTSIA